MKLNYLTLIILLLFSYSLTGQTNYYVSTSGSDSNDGLNLVNAWETVQHAMNNATPNSIVNITAGTYIEKVEVKVSGTTGNYICFQNYNNDIVEIVGTGSASSNDAIVAIFDQSYIKIKGLHIKDNEQLDAQGILVEGNCNHIEILGNQISNINFSTDPNEVATAAKNSQPLIVYGTNAANAITDLVIQGNIVRDSRTGYSEGLAVNGNVDGFEVSNNQVFNISNIGIDIIGHEGTASANDQARNGLVFENTVYDCKSPYATAAGIYVDGGKDLIITRNEIYNCQWGIEIGCESIGDSTSNIITHNNFIYSNDDAGITIGGFDYPSGSGKVVDCLVNNNTLYANDKLSTGLGGESTELNVSYTENCVITQNIIYAKTPNTLMLNVETAGMGLQLDYNLYYPNSGFGYNYNGESYSNFNDYSLAENQDLNSLNTDPLLIDINTNDLHISTSSPAKNSGNPSFVISTGELDFDGDNRVLETIIDIGADEYLSSDCITSLMLSGNISSGYYQTKDEIIANGIITNNQTVTFASEEIQLLDGFTVPINSELTIEINPCN